jgi:hypothetical protein
MSKNSIAKSGILHLIEFTINQTTMKNETKTQPKTKLSLKKEILASLDDSEIISLAGGFTSLGHVCSHENSCSRIHEPGGGGGGGFTSIGINCIQA